MAASYTPLRKSSIRLLEFLDDSGLTCSMKPYPRHIAPRYIALSYTWGPTAFLKGASASTFYSMTLNDEKISVQQNLHDALVHLGFQVRKRGQLFWVDALCINQNDIPERNEQVRHMKDIYESAANIFAWLGVPCNEQETKLAVKLMSKFNEHIVDTLRDNNNDNNFLSRSINVTHPGFPSEPESEVWKAWEGITGIFNRSYWQRVWIYQEATTPGEIIFFCGKHAFYVKLLYATIGFVEAFSAHPNFPARFAKAMGPTASARNVLSTRLLRSKPEDQVLADQMQVIRNADCTDPHDRVYAALGHALDVPAGRITVDYNMPIVELYIDVMRYLLLEADLNIRALGFVFTTAPNSSHEVLEAKVEPELPSWVPDWRQRVSIWWFPHEEFLEAYGNPLYSPMPGRPELSIDGAVLHVQGFVVEFVEITMLTDIFDEPRMSWETPYAWYTQVMQEYGGTSDLDQAIRRTLVADRTIVSRSRGEDEFRCKIRRGGSVDWPLIQQQRDTLDLESLRKQEDMEQDIFTVCHGSRMAVLCDLRLAILPPAAKFGDKIAAFRGGPTLFLVRGASGGFSLIGDCYVDGWMDGALVKEGRYSETTLKLV
ncbi:heterokaryon incompatibility protein-domain-containing protein [Phaeosphaeria sp. MPI-PUGE-AT-0046c]|nr:heterokaryon incompatibility protein-domain-containing protein [Phaeosphaeria sp. MPI-PUGE-AT-0046c]